MKYKFFFICFALIASIETIFAETVTIGNFDYELDNSNYTATVTDNTNYTYKNAITIPASVTYQGITYSVTSIKTYAFSGCHNITSVTIPNSVINIGDDAFRQCSRLASVSIGNGVTSIGKSAFASCTSLSSVTIPNSVTSIDQGAFKGCTSLPVMDNLRYADTYLIEAIDKTLSTYNIKQNTKWIGNDAFRSCHNLTFITIPNSVTCIGFCAFGLCTSLASVTIPSSVTNIEGNAFYGCSALTSVTIPAIVTSLGTYSFYECSNITKVTINSNAITSQAYTRDDGMYKIFGSQVKEYVLGNGVSAIGANAFYRCDSLTIITLPGSLSSIGNGAFEYCHKIKEVRYNGNLSQWCMRNWGNNSNFSHNYTLYIGNNKIENLSIPNDVTFIADRAFYGCSSLTIVTISDNVTDIGQDAFCECTNLKSVTIGNGVTNISKSAFSHCTELTTVIIGNNVLNIGDFAFSGCSSLTSLTIPNSVTSIGSRAFSYCTGLTSAIIGNNVERIGQEAFKNCTNLSNVVIGTNVTYIGDDTFQECSGLTSVTWNAKNYPNCTSDRSPFYSRNVNQYTGNIITEKWCISSQISSFIFGNEVEHIPAYLCYQMEHLLTISIPQNVRTIGKYAFSGCSKLNDVTFGNGILEIGEAAFFKCSSLVSANMGNNVESIGKDAFKNCTSLSNIVIGNNVTFIGNDALRGCSSLTSITWNAKDYPDCTIEHSPFYSRKCNQYNSGMYNTEWDISSQISSFIFGEEVEHIPAYLCYQMENLLTISIPQKVKTLGRCAFESCWYVKNVMLGNGVTSIGENAFQSCDNLTSLTIGSSTTNIGSNAFKRCNSLESVTCLAITPPNMGDGVFEGVECDKIPLYVSSQCVNAYKLVDQWKEFKPILAIGSSEEAIDEVKDNINVSEQKFIKDGQIFILRGDKTYTLQGQEVK